ncbi:hypothetical protein CDD82_3878 [Ophiocordyceps australis]|uniref:Uncharacterized protein n=1 Tax=Ophiocordyceps australis TaxID=1399860 RepID=A0A2C5Z9M5_9HYPO|nr:hypothetical protein CDD82_3878 [Ophiocordyceps australis]
MCESRETKALNNVACRRCTAARPRTGYMRPEALDALRCRLGQAQAVADWRRPVEDPWRGGLFTEDLLAYMRLQGPAADGNIAWPGAALAPHSGAHAVLAGGPLPLHRGPEPFSATIPLDRRARYSVQADYSAGIAAQFSGFPSTCYMLRATPPMPH